MSEKIIVLTGGGTAGHCLPCLALLPDLKKRFDKIVYIGSENGIEKELATKRGLEYHAVKCVGLKRKFTLKNLSVPFTLIRGIRQAEKLLKDLKPSAVFSKGGFVALPVTLAAERLKIPVALHESDISLGLANRLTLKRAATLMTGFKSTAAEYPNAVFTGNPLRRELTRNRDVKAIKRGYGFKDEKPVLLVLGGSSGAKAVNDAITLAADKLLENFCVIHSAGKGKTNGINKADYKQYEYIADMGAAYSVADVCVTRAGANALTELVALKIPTLAIPLPKGNSRGDQEENAEYYRSRGAIRVLSEKNLTTDALIKEIFATYAARDSLKRACEKCSAAAPNEKIVSEIIRISGI